MSFIRHLTLSILSLVILNSISSFALAQTNLTVGKSADPNPASSGENLTYTLTLINHGPLDAENVVLMDEIPTNTSFVSFTTPAGWTASTPAAGGIGTVIATKATLETGVSQTFFLVVNVNPDTPDGTLIENTVEVDSTDSDDNFSDNSFTTSTGVGLPPLFVDNVTVPETATEAVFTVIIPFTSDQPIPVNFFTLNGTAQSPADYEAVDGTLTIPPGETQQTISVPIHDDVENELDESFFLFVNNPDANVLPESALGIIVDDDSIRGVANGGCDMTRSSARLGVIFPVLILLMGFGGLRLSLRKL